MSVGDFSPASGQPLMPEQVQAGGGAASAEASISVSGVFPQPSPTSVAAVAAAVQGNGSSLTDPYAISLVEDGLSMSPAATQNDYGVRQGSNHINLEQEASITVEGGGSEQRGEAIELTSADAAGGVGGPEESVANRPPPGWPVGPPSTSTDPAAADGSRGAGIDEGVDGPSTAAPDSVRGGAESKKSVSQKVGDFFRSPRTQAALTLGMNAAALGAACTFPPFALFAVSYAAPQLLVDVADLVRTGSFSGFDDTLSDIGSLDLSGRVGNEGPTFFQLVGVLITGASALPDEEEFISERSEQERRDQTDTHSTPGPEANLHPSRNVENPDAPSTAPPPGQPAAQPARAADAPPLHQPHPPSGPNPHRQQGG